MDKAYNQLNNKLKDEKDRGIIAISLDKVIGKEKNIISKILLAKNKSALLYREANLVDNFAIEHQNIWHNFNHPNIIGIFFRFNFMSFLKEENILIQRYGLHTKGLYRTSEDECLLKELVKQIDIYS